MGNSGSFAAKVRGVVCELSNDEVKGLFDKWDADKSGSLDMVEFGPMFEDLGLLDGTEEENVAALESLFIEILCEVDESGDGLVSFDEFQDLVKLVSKPDAKEPIQGRDAKAIRKNASDLLTSASADGSLSMVLKEVGEKKRTSWP